MDIKILGPGCPRCEEVADLMHSVSAEAGADTTIEKVEDFNEIAKHGVFATPAVVVNGEVKCVGKVPSREEALAWLSS